MKLHLDKSAFETLLLSVSSEHNIRADIIEKDYYVTLLLEELAAKQRNTSLKAYFKGGTALYKIIGSTRRFSEDIDLTVCIDDCQTNNQAKKRLEEASKKYSCLNRNHNDVTNHDSKGSITCNYTYSSIANAETNDQLQRFGKVKVEATSFTVSEPTEQINITPILYDLASPSEKIILSKEYDIVPFNLVTITIERIFIDKVFASEFFYLRKQYTDVAKHIYDLAILLVDYRILSLIQNKKLVDKLIHIKKREEKSRIGSELANCLIKNFHYFHDSKNNKELLSAFVKMQSIYVFNENDRMSTQSLIDTVDTLVRIF